MVAREIRKINQCNKIVKMRKNKSKDAGQIATNSQ